MFKNHWKMSHFLSPKWTKLRAKRASKLVYKTGRVLVKVSCWMGLTLGENIKKARFARNTEKWDFLSEIRYVLLLNYCYVFPNAFFSKNVRSLLTIDRQAFFHHLAYCAFTMHDWIFNNSLCGVKTRILWKKIEKCIFFSSLVDQTSQ